VNAVNVSGRPPTINLNGVEYVTLADWQAARDERDAHRRTLAMAHMHLTEGDDMAALRVIRRDTGDDAGDARAVRDVVNWALNARKPTDAAVAEVRS